MLSETRDVIDTTALYLHARGGNETSLESQAREITLECPSRLVDDRAACLPQKPSTVKLSAQPALSAKRYDTGSLEREKVRERERGRMR